MSRIYLTALSPRKRGSFLGMASRAIMVSSLLLLAFAMPASAAPAVGEAAPALVVREIGGAPFDLSNLRGKVVIVNFWATWCPPCREEMPALDAFYAKFRDRGVALIGISLDRSRERDAVLAVAKTIGYPLAMLSDADSNGFGKPSALPVTYVLDAQGIVRAVMTPDVVAVSEGSLEAVVTPLLAGGGPPKSG